MMTPTEARERLTIDYRWWTPMAMLARLVRLPLDEDADLGDLLGGFAGNDPCFPLAPDTICVHQVDANGYVHAYIADHPDGTSTLVLRIENPDTGTTRGFAVTFPTRYQACVASAILAPDAPGNDTVLDELVSDGEDGSTPLTLDHYDWSLHVAFTPQVIRDDHDDPLEHPWHHAVASMGDDELRQVGREAIADSNIDHAIEHAVEAALSAHFPTIREG